MRGHLISNGFRCWVGAVANRVYQMVAVVRGPVPRHASLVTENGRAPGLRPFFFGLRFAGDRPPRYVKEEGFRSVPQVWKT